jgi:tRNA A37 threonylcarbamoyladenosine synthetase subunit TsaC/SUA5/YrdC
VGCPSLRVVDIPSQWDARDAKRCFSIRVHGIIKGGPVVTGVASEVVGVGSEGVLY